MERYHAEIIVRGGPRKEDMAVSEELDVFPSEMDTPFDPFDEEDIKDYLYEEFGPGWYRVFAPGDIQRMNTYFKGPVGDVDG